MIKTFEDFPVYKKGLQLTKQIHSLCACVKGGEFSFLKDQVRRASTSIILNIAEGAGKWGKKDKANFYRMAKGSCNECIAAIDIFKAYNIIDTKNENELKELLRSIAIELQALTINIEKRS